MAKRKATSSSQSPSHDKKKAKVSLSPNPNTLKLLDYSSDDESVDGVELQESELTVNEEFAKRFEHNRKREELQRLEEKYSKTKKNNKGDYGDKYDEDSESSNDEEEDDAGFLATEALDNEISATLQAIRSKDPVVYDSNFSFYKPIEEDQENKEVVEPKVTKPMYLRDYHRENLLKGHVGEESTEDPLPMQTFAQKQEELQNSIIKEMHAAINEESDEDDDKNFLVPKASIDQTLKSGSPKKSKAKPILDVNTAEKDPETFLSNFMAARAWIPDEKARFQPLESDDESEDERAEMFESAYNLRFEDPAGSNEILKSYARDTVAAKSVRRDEKSSRKKQRDLQREKKEAERRKQEEERARLRRLKVEELEERVQMIKKAAGLRGKSLVHDEIFDFLNENWDNDEWSSTMSKYFGEEYYADQEAELEAESEDGVVSEKADNRKKKIKKPKWDDDIDIKDILPDFVEEEADETDTRLSEPAGEEEENENLEEVEKSKSRKNSLQAKHLTKKEAQIERKRIEDLVDSRLDFTIAGDPKKPNRFRYRETSPTSFGLTVQDILMAPDSSLNQYAGLKKMAPFRDAEKKRRDKKKLGKKARLRQWRKETFGNEDGPEIVIAPQTQDKVETKSSSIVEGARKKKKRSRKKNSQNKSNDQIKSS
ncbi:Protein kri1 [Golovinomyces cichoracearum]|uniref:Protein kri1 n=1 Tax=Golovinomyces cichoracearum TaxID=62708 RepID=A0A420I018_9PEZI|nr:Protein kri1 [Golovinomyces cichoracearum]